MLNIKHPLQSLLSKIGDYLMLPVMYLLQGNVREVPQQTHFWNNKKYHAKNLTFLSSEMIVTVKNDEDATQRYLGIIPIFHMPIIGGWKKFVVLAPRTQQDIWYIGWVAGDVIGISQIKLDDKVRVLRGPSIVQFFGINEHGQQIAIDLISEGKIGDAGKYSQVPLL